MAPQDAAGHGPVEHAVGQTHFIADYLRGLLSIAELCPRDGISRTTCDKVIDRYLRSGPTGLEGPSRRPHQSPNQTAPQIMAALLEAMRCHPTGGAKKLLTLQHKRHPLSNADS